MCLRVTQKPYVLREKVGAAVVVRRVPINRRIPSDASIFSAELKAISMTFENILIFGINTRRTRYIIYSDSLSSFQALQNLNLDNRLVLQIVNKL